MENKIEERIKNLEKEIEVHKQNFFLSSGALTVLQDLLKEINKEKEAQAVLPE